MNRDQRQVCERRVAHSYLSDRTTPVAACALRREHFSLLPGLWEALEKARHLGRQGLEWDLFDVADPKLIDAMGAPPRVEIKKAEARLIYAWRRRELARLGEVLAEKLAGDTPETELRSDVAAMQSVLQMSGPTRGVSLSSALKQAQKNHAHELKDPRAIPMNLTSMQKAYGGWRRGKLHLICAPTSQHKTTLAVQAWKFSSIKGYRCCYITLEDDATDIAERVAVSEVSGLTLKHLVGRDSITAEHPRMMGEWERLAETEWAKRAVIVDAALDLPTLEGEIRSQAARGLDLCVVDFMQLISSADRRVDPVQHAAACATTLQATAKECDIALLCCVQPTQAATRGDAPVEIGDIRGGSAIAQAAFAVIVCHRPAIELAPNEEPPRTRDLNVYVRKWKKGPTPGFFGLKVEGGRDRIYEEYRG